MAEPINVLTKMLIEEVTNFGESIGFTYHSNNEECVNFTYPKYDPSKSITYKMITIKLHGEDIRNQFKEQLLKVL